MAAVSEALAQVPDSPNAVRAYWQSIAAATLPPEEAVRARNRAITATYARWYLSAPHLFKWAGAAAFASQRVGVALLPFGLTVRDGETIAVLASDPAHQHPHIVQDLERIRTTNNLVFADIGWAHAAYLAPHGGLQVIQSALQSLPSHALLLEGFQKIDQGRRRLHGSTRDRTAAEALIWSGNRLLLRHEQWVTVQPQFAQLHPAFRVFLSLMTSMDFDADNLTVDWTTHTAFTPYMWTRGLGLLLWTRALPDITNIRHRWSWVERRVLRIWQKVDAHDADLREKLRRLTALAVG